jgi:hypothetical protein
MKRSTQDYALRLQNTWHIIIHLNVVASMANANGSFRSHRILSQHVQMMADGKHGMDLESEMDGSRHIILCFFFVCRVIAIFRSQMAQRQLLTSSNTRWKVMPQFVHVLRKSRVDHHCGGMRLPIFKRLEWLVRQKICSAP